MTPPSPTAVPDAAALAAAVSGCPAVAGMHAGPVASYLPGSRIPGVSLADGRVALHVDLLYPHTVAELHRQVREAVRPLLAGAVLDVTVADLVVPEPPAAASNPVSGGPS